MTHQEYLERQKERALEQEKLKGLKLIYKDRISAGNELYVEFDQDFDFQVYKIPYLIEKHLLCNDDYVKEKCLLAYAPWVQFMPPEYTNSMKSIFREVDDLWNGTNKPKIQGFDNAKMDIDIYGKDTCIRLNFAEGFNFIEVKTKPGPHTIFMQDRKSMFDHHSPWDCFKKEGFELLMERIFKKIITLWNNKYLKEAVC